MIGTKALLDALKMRTTGRRNGVYLHYFGAIVDDGLGFVDLEWRQELVKHPRDAGIRIQVVSQAKASNTAVALKKSL